MRFIDTEGEYIVSSDGKYVYRTPISYNKIQSVLSYVAPVTATSIKYLTGDPSWGVTASDLAGPIGSWMLKGSRFILNIVGNISKEANIALSASEKFNSFILSLGIDVQTSAKIENNLLMDREIFNIASKLGLGELRQGGRILAVKKNVNKTKLNQYLKSIESQIKTRLENRKLNELTEDELEKLRNSIELKGE